MEHLEASPQHHKSTSADMWEVLDDQVILTNTNDEWGGDGGQEGVEGSQGGRGGGGQGGGGGGVFGGKGVRSLSISRSSSVVRVDGVVLSVCGVGGVCFVWEVLVGVGGYWVLYIHVNTHILHPIHTPSTYIQYAHRPHTFKTPTPSTYI